MRNKSHVLVTLLSRECLYSGNWRSILSVRYYVLLAVHIEYASCCGKHSPLTVRSTNSGYEGGSVGLIVNLQLISNLLYQPHIPLASINPRSIFDSSALPKHDTAAIIGPKALAFSAVAVDVMTAELLLSTSNRNWPCIVEALPVISLGKRLRILSTSHARTGSVVEQVNTTQHNSASLPAYSCFRRRQCYCMCTFNREDMNI